MAAIRRGMMSEISTAVLKRVVIDPIVNGVKGFFGIHSPSTVMADGSNLVAGLLRGLAGNVSHIASTVFGGMPQALGAIVKKGILTVTQLPGKALSALVQGLRIDRSFLLRPVQQRLWRMRRSAARAKAR